jgi:acyl-CoA synthetase (AMP-forming)/AMP-acid ligase II
VSPTELEEVLYASGLVGEVVALGLPHPVLGQCIVLVVTPPRSGKLDADGMIDRCRQDLPSFMIPQRIVERSSLPRNPNGKIDRKALAAELSEAREEKVS